MPMMKSRQDFITSKLVQMCAQDCRPLSIAEGKGFKEFCTALNPNFKIPVHATIKTHLKLDYERKKAQLIENLKGKDVAFTTDLWSSLGKQGFITLTYHFISDDWIMKSGVLATRHMPEKHSGLNIATRIDEIREEFGIKPEQVAGISSDNASNMDVAVDALGYSDTTCFGHTLQLAINSALAHSDIEECLSAARNLVSHFNHLPKATGELRRVTGNCKALQQDVPTRWNSTFHMISSLIPNRTGIYTVLHNKEFTKPDVAKKLEIKTEHWALIEKLCEVLKPFDIATSQLSGELYPTLGSVYPLIYGVIGNHLLVKDSDRTVIAHFKATVTEKMNARFRVGNEQNCDNIITSALHPCHKKLKFLGPESRALVQEKLKVLCSKVPLESHKVANEEEAHLPTKIKKVQHTLRLQ